MPKIPKSGVYCILNTLTDKKYIGSASGTIIGHWKMHLEQLREGIHVNKHLQRAWDKYGEAAFEIITIELCKPESCIAREQHWLDFYKAYNPLYGYNICPTAGSMLGFKHSEESKQKLSLIMQNRDPEIRRLQGDKLRGRKHTPEHIAKIKAKSGNRKGVKLSEETKAKISAVQKGIPKSEEFKAHLAKIRTGWKFSEESKAKMRVSAQARCARQATERKTHHG